MCPECGILLNENNLKRHIDTQHREANVNLEDTRKCETCNLYIKKSNFSRHVKNKHTINKIKINKVLNKEKKIFTCNQCDKKYQTKIKLEYHVDIKHKQCIIKSTLCQKCGITVSNSNGSNYS